MRFIYSIFSLQMVANQEGDQQILAMRLLKHLGFPYLEGIVHLLLQALCRYDLVQFKSRACSQRSYTASVFWNFVYCWFNLFSVGWNIGYCWGTTFSINWNIRYCRSTAFSIRKSIVYYWCTAFSVSWNIRYGWGTTFSISWNIRYC